MPNIDEKKEIEAEEIEKKPEVEQKEVPEVEKPEEEPFDKDRAMNTIHKLRESEKQAKKDKARLDELEAAEKKRAEAEMTEVQKAQKKAEEAEAKNAKLELDIMRRDVIAESGLPATFADRLKGTTKEEMLEDAKALLKEIPALKQAPKLGPSNPANGHLKETDEQKRVRIFGRQNNIFDSQAIKDGGGGVVWNRPTETEANKG